MEPRRPIVTFVLVGMNVAAFLAMVASGISPTQPGVEQLLAVGANRGTLVVFQHEYWRALTSMFIHIGVLHLAVNMYSLWRVGAFVERMLGGPLYVLVYTLAGLGGAFASVLWNPVNVSAGASGAIFGLFGFVMGFAIQARHLLPPDAAKSLWDGILATLAINLFLAFSVPYLDNAAHLGGAVIGLLAGFVATASALEREGRGAAFSSQLIVIAAVIGLAVLAGVRTQNNPRAHAAELMQKAQEAFQARQFEQVEALTSKALESGKEPLALILRSFARNERGDKDGGLSDVTAAIDTMVGTDASPQLLAEAFALRAGAHQVDGRFAEADADLSRAYRLRPDPAYVGLRGYARLRLGDADGGLQDVRATLSQRGADAMVLNNLAWGLLATGQDLGLALELVNASIARSPSAAAKGTRCWIQVARGLRDEALADCLAAVEGANEVMDRGMVAFLQGRPDEAVQSWEEASRRNPVDAADVAPWLEAARAQLDAGAP
ncbi:MAG: rhomboid family intramembrane serine protease [Myxococcaceae bacterium]|nr:rhomboid family intramembrane serine protease [Myxococcaceae bacterium]